MDRLLAVTPISSTGLQVVIEYSVLLRDDFTVEDTAQMKIVGPDGKKVPYYSIYRKKGDLGKHAEFTDHIDNHPESRMMARAEFDTWNKCR
jgi:hypothetical protein